MSAPDRLAPPIVAADLDDEEAVASLSRALKEWEPHLEVEVRRGEARPYDGDAVGYHFVLRPGGRLEVNRRSVPIEPGDLFVLPTAFAIDADPPLDLLIVRHFGTPPGHHRERFLQVEGIDHVPIRRLVGDPGPGDAWPPRLAPLRIEFAGALRPQPGAEPVRRKAGFVPEFGVVSAGEIEIRVELAPGEDAARLAAPAAFLVRPGSTYVVCGDGLATTWRVEAEPAYEARRWR